jgi:hypothetical protein
MASAPPEAPTTIILGKFSGIKNTVSEKRLKQDELVAAVNVDIDDAGQLRRRRGRTRVNDLPHHSLKQLGDMVLVVRDNMLGQLHGLAFTPIVWVGAEALSYVRVGDTVYFSSSDTSGKITNGIWSPWGNDGAGQWVSPVTRPTETLGEIRGRRLTAPPHATSLEAYKGRIYLAHGRVLWATELYLYDHVDKTRNFMQFEADITMIAAVGDGLYVGTTDELLFIQGTMQAGMQLTHVIPSGVVAGSCVTVPYSKSVPQARTTTVPEGAGPMFMTNAGIVVGLDSGTAYNLTQDHVVFPGAVAAAALYREDQGANAYVAVADSAGGPSANARIGDYVDAEIVRASQRG